MSAEIIIVTRPRADALEFAAAARAAGMAPILSPVIRIVSLGADPGFANVAALAFTSANGVRSFRGDRRDLPAFVVGDATARAARLAGFVDVRVACGDWASLCDLIVAAVRSGDFAGPVTHVTGEDQAVDLVAELARNNVAARRAVVYAARASDALSPQAATAIGRASTDLWAALFSPRSARIFVELARREGLSEMLTNAGVACLSGAVADAAAAVKWREIAVASERTDAALIAAIVARRGGGQS